MQLREELSLPAAEGVRAAPHQGSAAPTIVSIREITLGDATIRGAVGALMPLSNLVGPGGPRGVLSAASFPGYLLTLDFPARQISVKKGKLEKSDPETFDYPLSDPLAATGQIGARAPRNFVVTLDMRNHRIHFVQPPPRPA